MFVLKQEFSVIVTDVINNMTGAFNVKLYSYVWSGEHQVAMREFNILIRCPSTFYISFSVPEEILKESHNKTFFLEFRDSFKKFTLVLYQPFARRELNRDENVINESNNTPIKYVSLNSQEKPTYETHEKQKGNKKTKSDSKPDSIGRDLLNILAILFSTLLNFAFFFVILCHKPSTL